MWQRKKVTRDEYFFYEICNHDQMVRLWMMDK